MLASLRQRTREAAWLLGVWLLLGTWGGQRAVVQDTLATQGVELTPIEATPAAQPAPAADTAGLVFTEAATPALGADYATATWLVMQV